MTSKELLENIIIDCEYYGKDKATIDKETIESIKKDLEVLEILKDNIVYVPPQIQGVGIYIVIPFMKENKENKDYFEVKGWLDNGKD